MRCTKCKTEEMILPILVLVVPPLPIGDSHGPTVRERRILRKGRTTSRCGVLLGKYLVDGELTICTTHILTYLCDR